MFQLLGTDPSSKARRGILRTKRGDIATPQFMPVGTQGSVKAVSPDELTQLGAQIILGNTYHLFVRPGMEVMRKFGGLHRFMGWDGPILTDSGGFQVFSLAKLRKITPDGVHFQNHLDGSPMFLGPRETMEIQAMLGSDICMLFDECPPHPCERDYAAKNLALTLKWAAMCKEVETPRTPCWSRVGSVSQPSATGSGPSNPSTHLPPMPSVSGGLAGSLMSRFRSGLRIHFSHRHFSARFQGASNAQCRPTYTRRSGPPRLPSRRLLPTAA